jgi:hypothetical protein
MKNDHIPFLSYIFIGVTSLVLTYATIADTNNEVVVSPPESIDEPTAESTLSMPSVPSYNETVEKLQTINPFSSSTDSQNTIPVAVPVDSNNTNISNPPSYGGGRKSSKHKKNKHKNTKRKKAGKEKKV